MARKRKCPCGEWFSPKNTFQTACCIKGSLARARAVKGKKLLADIKKRREALKTRSDYMKEAQREFNKWIRIRDDKLPCISCGSMERKAWDAGHYRSVVAAPALRFHELNVHKQCIPCNQHKSSNAIEYRIGLVAKIGLEAVERLEASNEPRKYTIAELVAIKSLYRAKLKELTAHTDNTPHTAHTDSSEC